MSSTPPTGQAGPPPPPNEPGEGRTATLRRSMAERQGQPAAEASASSPSTARYRTSAPSAASAEPTGGYGREERVPAAGPRRVRLSVSRVDPWSAMKLSFLLSVALGVMLVVAAAMVWFVLDSMHVFADVEELLVSIGSENFLQLMDYVAFDRVMSFAIIVAVVDILLLTALGTIGAFLYNIVAALVGGLHLTLTDD